MTCTSRACLDEGGDLVSLLHRLLLVAFEYSGRHQTGPPPLNPLSDQNILSAPSDAHAILTDISLGKISSYRNVILSDIGV